MYVPTDVRFFGDNAQCLVAHILGMTRGKSYAHSRHGVCHLSEQVGEADVLLAVAVHILPQQCHFFESALLQVLHFAQNALYIAATLASSRVGNNAVVAEIVAATHDGNKTAYVRSAKPLRNDVAIRFGGRKFHVDGLLPTLHLSHQLGQRQVCVGSDHQICVIFLDEAVLHTLRHAAEHAHDEAATFLAAQALQKFQPSQNFLLSVVSYRTRVQKNGVGLFHGIARLVSGHFHHRGDDFAVGNIHLATVSFYEKTLHFAPNTLLRCKDTKKKREMQIVRPPFAHSAPCVGSFRGESCCSETFFCCRQSVCMAAQEGEKTVGSTTRNHTSFCFCHV